MYKAAKPAIGKKVIGKSTASRRNLNSLYKKNTGTTTKSRNARVKKYK